MSGPSDYLAAERTFLAWIRTGLALMGFGFVAARFGLFLQALQISQSNPGPRPYGPSFWFGTALIVLGVFVNIGSLRSHVRLCPRVEARGIRLRPPVEARHRAGGGWTGNGDLSDFGARTKTNKQWKIGGQTNDVESRVWNHDPAQ